MRQRYDQIVSLARSYFAPASDTAPEIIKVRKLSRPGGETMAGFPAITVRQPQPFDLVDDPVEVCGIGTGFEATFAARVRDTNGSELVQISIMAGGMGIWGNFHDELVLPGVPATPHGILEVFEFSAADGSEINKVVVPITFGTALLAPYHGFAQHPVAAGESLSVIAQQWYGDPNQWPRLFEANRNQIVDPNLIFPGQVLRVPQ
jgi:LysM repeat protein